MFTIEFKGHKISQCNGFMLIDGNCAGVRSLIDAMRIINGLKPKHIDYHYAWDEETKSVVEC